MVRHLAKVKVKVQSLESGRNLPGELKDVEVMSVELWPAQKLGETPADWSSLR